MIASEQVVTRFPCTQMPRAFPTGRDDKGEVLELAVKALHSKWQDWLSLPKAKCPVPWSTVART